MTANIIERLWGIGPVHGFVCSRENGRFIQQHVETAAEAMELAAKISDRRDCWFSIATFKSPLKRTAENALTLSAVAIDIDCGADKVKCGKGYANKTEAKQALIGFCASSGIPAPTDIIDSGYGLHCYWMLDKPLPADSWVVHTQKLKELLDYHGLIADKTVTGDPSQILRIPDTYNRKDPENPKKVIQKCSGDPLSTDRLLHHIDHAYKQIQSTATAVTNKHGGVDPSLIDKIAAAAANERPSLWKGNWELTETDFGKYGYPSQSEADFSMVGTIARHAIKAGVSSDHLPQVIAEVFMQSELYRPTKFERVLNHDIPNMCASLIHEAVLFPKSGTRSPTTGRLNLVNGVIDISDALPQPRDFVINDLLLAAKSAVLAGQGGVAKSQLVLQFGVAVALGLPIFGFRTSAGSVILLMGEEDADEVYRRINAIAKAMHLTPEQKALLMQRLRAFPLVGADIRLTKSISMSVESTGFSDEIVEAATQLEQQSGLPVRLIGLDHAGLVHGGEFNSREDVVQTMRQVNYIAKTTGAAVLMLAHSPKSTAGSEMSSSQDVAGNAAWVDLSRAAFVMRCMSDAEGKKLGIGSDDRKRYVSLTTVKGNYIPTGDLIWLAKNKVDGYEVSYLTHAKLTSSGLPKVGGNRKLRAAIIELVAQKDLTKTGIERYSGKTGDLRASKGAINAEVDAMLQDGELILVQPTDEQRRTLGIKGHTSGFLKSAQGAPR